MDRIFLNDKGKPIKFFVQKDLPEDVQDDLTRDVEDLGGRVTAAMPLAGYILIDRDTDEGERLRATWTDKTRPDRYFVPLTWVDACRAHKLELRQIFVKEGQPLKIYIHPSVANENVVEAFELRIVYCGGFLTEDEVAADIILADPDVARGNFARLVSRYPKKNIEFFTWVKKCIELGVLQFTTDTQTKNVGGRRAGDSRNEFTSEEDEKMCQWMAEQLPHKADRGRTGNTIWKELESKKDIPGFEWVRRHSWQSWRDHFKKTKRGVWEARIDEIVAEKNSLEGRPVKRARTHA